jgi:hypothetical protein
MVSALAPAACAMPDFDSFRAPSADALFRPLSVTNVKDRVLPPVGLEELVDASGYCAAANTPLAAASGDQPGAQTNVAALDSAAPAIPSAVALDMSECDVVKRAGSPERVEIGANERNERMATLTYIHGVRPGIYTFVAGRLKTMERAPEPPASAKPAKKPTRPAKNSPSPQARVSAQ